MHEYNLKCNNVTMNHIVLTPIGYKIDKLKQPHLLISYISCVTIYPTLTKLTQVYM